jgi:arylsulfatase A-like enzyme
MRPERIARFSAFRCVHWGSMITMRPTRAILVAVLWTLLQSASALATPPNVVLIISDDHGWTDYGFMGHRSIRTPHLDRLARESLTFGRGYVTSSLCCPSLASIITGRYPHQHKITSNDPRAPEGVSRREFNRSPAFVAGREVMNGHLDAVPTLPRLLRERGYQSFQSGTWWQGPYSRGGFTHGMTQGERHGDQGLDIGRRSMQPIFEFIAGTRREQKPFLVWYAPMMPHSPHTPPERLLEHYRTNAPSEHAARYWAMVEWFDETVGELLAHLDEQGLADNTIVIYLADNGWIQSPDGANYAPKSKQSQYDGGLRTPIMIRWPGHIVPRMSDALAQSIDLAPTILTATESAPDRSLPGIDLADPKALAERRAIFGECFTHDAIDLDRPAANLRWRWVIEGTMKLIVPDAKNEPDAEIELYDLAADPHEERNLAVGQPEMVAALRDRLNAWWNPAQER